jgi:hypothetical protein
MTTGVTIAETAQATTAMPLWITKIKAMTAATWKQVVATVAWLATNPVGWIMLAVGAIALLTTAIVTVNKFIDKHNQKVIEAGKTAHDTIEQAKSDLESLTSSAEEAVETYSRLIDGVNTLNNTNTGLSDEDYEDFIASSNELAELFPELIIGLDSEGNYILDLGDNAEEATSKINTLIEAQQRLVAEETENNLVDVFKGIKKETEDSTEELKKYQNELDNFRVNGFIADLQGAAGQSGGKNISLSKEYMDNVDSLELMNNVKKIVNDALGTNLEVESNDLTGEYFLDLTELTEEQYEQAIQALYLNSDLLSDKVSEQIELAINNTKSEINKEYQDELPEIFTALSDDDIYTSLDGNQKTLADLLISKLDYSSVRGEIARKYDNDISAYIKDVILKPFQDLTDEDKQTDL